MKGASGRANLWDLARNLSNTDIEDVSFYEQDPTNSNKLANAYMGSRFCFVPNGDTPTSRRLYDALAAGCVPVSVGSSERLMDNLPFKRSIDWTRVLLFAGSLECIEKDGWQTAQWLNRLQEKTQVLMMGETGQEIFRNYLAYDQNSTGLVGALLRELEYEVAFPSE